MNITCILGKEQEWKAFHFSELFSKTYLWPLYVYRNLVAFLFLFVFFLQNLAWSGPNLGILFKFTDYDRVYNFVVVCAGALPTYQLNLQILSAEYLLETFVQAC